MSDTSENRIDDWKKDLLRLAAFADWVEARILSDESFPESDWEPFVQELRPLLAEVESASTREELNVVIDRLRRVVEKHDLRSVFRTWLVKACPELRSAVQILFPPQLGGVKDEDVSVFRGIEHIELGGGGVLGVEVGEIEEVGEAKGGVLGVELDEEVWEAAEEEEPEPRYANVDLVDHTTTTRCDPARSLAVRTEYHLRIDIGKLRDTTVVKDARKHVFPDKFLPKTDEGHWLDVVVTSEEFNIEREQYALFLPDSGAGWVCDCERNGRHHCKPEEREPSLYVPVTSPGTPGEATLRIGFYYENNLLQCQLFTAQVGVEVPGKPGYEAEVDYTLTGTLTNVGRLPARTLNIFTNENADGSHRVILVGKEHVRHRSLSEVQVRELLEEARKELHGTHRELIRPAKINKNTGEVILKAEYKLLLKTIGGVTNAKNRNDFIADLEKLARLGSLLWVTLFHGEGDSRRVLRDILKEQATIQVGRAKNNGSPLFFPWGLIYDIHLDLLAPTQWHPCKLLEDWRPGKPLADPGVTRCPHDDGKNHRKNVICPFGFWGFKHILEQPPSMPEGRDLPLEITLSDGQPEVAVGFSRDLYKPEVHIAELTKQLSKKARVLAKDSKDDILEMLGKTDLEFVYFFCHGRREKLSGTELWLPYLEVGDNEPITPADLMSWQDDLPADHWQKTSPLVFINGCHTAELTPDALADFVSGFVDANAGGVIGTEVTVSQDLASEAALLFFSYLLENGGTVGQAIRQMRFDFLSRGNLMGLAYTPYCSASLHLKK